MHAMAMNSLEWSMGKAYQSAATFCSMVPSGMHKHQLAGLHGGCRGAYQPVHEHVRSQ